MMEDEVRDEEEIDPDALDTGDEAEEGDEEVDPTKKKKDLIDDDTVSLEDEADEELEEVEEPFDDVNDQ